MEIKLKIFRFNPDTDPIPYYTTYTLPWSEGMTLLAAISTIYTEIDPTLAFRNYYCGRGLCAGCKLTINSVVKKACHVVLEPNKEYLVEPPKNYPVIRDLVVDFGNKKIDNENEKTWRLKEGMWV